MDLFRSLFLQLLPFLPFRFPLRSAYFRKTFGLSRILHGRRPTCFPLLLFFFLLFLLSPVFHLLSAFSKKTFGLSRILYGRRPTCFLWGSCICLRSAYFGKTLGLSRILYGRRPTCYLDSAFFEKKLPLSRNFWPILKLFIFFSCFSRFKPYDLEMFSDNTAYSYF